MSGFVNKVKDVLSGDHKTDETTDTAHTGHPTHIGTGSTNAGPHASNVANKADPRVDSDLGECIAK